jgi:hypothetical protein
MTSAQGRPSHLCPNGASACQVNGSMEQFYDYRLANATIDTLRFAKVRPRCVGRMIQLTTRVIPKSGCATEPH